MILRKVFAILPVYIGLRGAQEERTVLYVSLLVSLYVTLHYFIQYQLQASFSS
jgi:hypothetical protein